LAEVNWAGWKNNLVNVSVMHNRVRSPSYDAGREIDRYTAIVRCYLWDWSALNVGLHAEYTYRERGEKNIRKEHLVAMTVDSAF
jgi:hypothetical protein